MGAAGSGRRSSDLSQDEIAKKLGLDEEGGTSKAKKTRRSTRSVRRPTAAVGGSGKLRGLGMSCYIEAYPPDDIYGKAPVVAQYTIEIFDLSDDYPNCPDAPCPNNVCPASPQRNCQQGDPYHKRAGLTRCGKGAFTCDCAYSGAWYGFPALGECRKPTDVPGYDCYWRVLAMDGIVPFGGVRHQGCKLQGACTPGGSHGGGGPGGGPLRAPPTGVPGRTAAGGLPPDAAATAR